MSRRARKDDGGFTLVEILLALAILGLVTVVLLDKRVQAVRDAQKIKDGRLAWTLAAWKLSELEMDRELLMSAFGKTDAGTFEELSPDYAGYVWDLEMEREKLETNDPEDPAEAPREVWRVKLAVRLEAESVPLVVLEAMLPVEAEEAPQSP